MAIEADFQAVLSPLVSGRICALFFQSQPQQRPYITFQVVSNVPLTTLEGQTGTEQLRIQVDFWGDTYAQVKKLEIDAKAAMQVAPFVSLPVMSVDGYEADARLFRVTTDFSVWSQ